jgi:hypothetical protein
MDLAEQQGLALELKKLVEEKAAGREYCLIFSMEIGEKGSGSSFAATITSPTPMTAMGSWKGILYLLGKQQMGLSNFFMDFSKYEAQPPIQPKK